MFAGGAALLLTGALLVHLMYPIVISLGRHDMDVSQTIGYICVMIGVYLIIMVIAVILMIMRLLRFLKKRIITPIKTLSETAVKYTERDKTVPEGSKRLFKELDISTGDEIEDLWKSLSDMEDDINDTMERIRSMTSEQERLNTELSIASQIQSDILPRTFPPFPERKEFALYAQMIPARNVAGDFYDFFLTDDDHIALVIADVSDKGIPAALFMMTARTLVKNHAMLYVEPSDILSHVNAQLCEGNEAALFVTIWLAIIEISSGKGVAVNAGHMHPALSRGGGEYELLKYDHSLPLGVTEIAEFPQHDFILESGDRLFVYTDGVTDAADKDEAQFGYEGMLDALNSGKNDNPEDTIGSVMDSINKFTAGEDQTDDITMLSFHFM